MTIRPVDADGHVQEPAEELARFLPSELRGYAPRYFQDDQGRYRQAVGGQPLPYIPAPEGGWDIPAGGNDPKRRLADMDRQGVEQSVLFPTLGLAFAGLADTDVQIAMCRAYNDWLAEFCSADARRLVGVAVVAQADIGAALGEARRAVEELGFRAVMMRPNPVRGRGLDHVYWKPLWSLLEELDVPVAVHEGTTGDLPQSGRDRFENFAMRHVASHPHEQQLACLALTMGGVLEQHPKLRAIFLESGCGWLPHWLERMDEHMESWGHCTAKLPLLPSEYFARQCFISCDPAERGVEAFVAQLGADCLVFASDYPHPDALADDVVGAIADREGLAVDARAKILEDNARRCFGL